jgi:ketosteroid isomerase-like protein
MSESEITETSATADSKSANVMVLEEIYEAVLSRDIPSVLAHFDPEIEYRLAEGHLYSPGGETWVGGEAVVRNFFARAGREWDRSSISRREFHVGGDTVVVEGRYGGVYKATGKRFDAQFCHVWKLSDGRAKSFQQYLDTAQLQEVARG